MTYSTRLSPKWAPIILASILSFLGTSAASGQGGLRELRDATEKAIREGTIRIKKPITRVGVDREEEILYYDLGGADLVDPEDPWGDSVDLPMRALSIIYAIRHSPLEKEQSADWGPTLKKAEAIIASMLKAPSGKLEHVEYAESQSALKTRFDSLLQEAMKRIGRSRGLLAAQPEPKPLVPITVTVSTYHTVRNKYGTVEMVPETRSLMMMGEKDFYSVDLDTNPKGGEIYYLPALRYVYYQTKKMTPPWKKIVQKKHVRLAGDYWFLVRWGDGTSAGPNLSNISDDQSLTLP